MHEELTDPSKLTEQEFLSCMTNDLYRQKYSVITECFPIGAKVGRRLVDVELLKREEYEKLCQLLSGCHHPESAGTILVKYLQKRGPDSMRRFYEVLLEFRDGDTDVNAILEQLEEAAAAAFSHRRRKPSILSDDIDMHVDTVKTWEETATDSELQGYRESSMESGGKGVEMHMDVSKPLEKGPTNGQGWKKASFESDVSSGFNSSVSSSSTVFQGHQQPIHCSRNLRTDVKQMGNKIDELTEEVAQLRVQLALVLENTFTLLHTVGTSSGRPSIVSTVSNATFANGSSGHFSSHGTNWTFAKAEYSTRNTRAQSEPDVSMQLRKPLRQPLLSKRQQMDTLQTVPEEMASVHPSVPHYSSNARGDTHGKEGTGGLDCPRASSTAATNASEDSCPSPGRKKTQGKYFKLFRRKPHGP